MTQQIVLYFIPGYYWDGYTLQTTGVALKPTQHVDPKNGEIKYYVRPVGWCHSAYIRRDGILDYIKSLEGH